ncbi:MAG TPA: hypothetical protein VNK26_03545 [Pyrinomonadaceae bacterium]|jgi:hypothetical protein|nr:hypothetical protein [Pyrinomonadaceae bacterium]
MPDKDFDKSNARLAFTIIESLLAINEAQSDFLALMSAAMDEEIIKAMTITPEWQRYLETRRQLDNTRKQIEEFTEALKTLENA